MVFLRVLSVTFAGTIFNQTIHLIGGGYDDFIRERLHCRGTPNDFTAIGGDQYGERQGIWI